MFRTYVYLSGTDGGFPHATPLVNIEAWGAMAFKSDNRRHQRIRYLGAARISWDDERGLASYADAKCMDVSQEGLCIVVADTVPVRSLLSLRVERIKVGGSATVKYVARRGRKCVLGLNLSQPVPKNSLDLALHSSPDCN